MKKILPILMGVALLTSCTKQTLTPNNETEGSVIFEISAGASRSITKAAMYAQEPVLHVTNVKVHAFKSNGTDFLFVKTFDIAGWTDGLTFKRFAVPDADTLARGTYKFLAVGRNTTDQYTITTPTVGVTKFDSICASISATGNEADIYSGYSQIDIVGKGTRVAIDMKRKVAGVIGYFKNVPQVLNATTVKFLRLSVSNVNQAVYLSSGTGVPTALTPYNIINIDLSTQAVANGVYVGNDLSAQGVVKVANSQLGGMYLIPVSGVTLKLGLYDAGGVAIKEWSIMNGPSSSFDLTANNLYTLGQKMKPGSTDNGTPETGDDDNPVDLLTDQAIAITITPAWDVVNNLVIQ